MSKPIQGEVKAPDPYVEANRQELLQRSILGVKKYGTTLKDNPVPASQFCQHAIEEALDFANYLQVLKSRCEHQERLLVDCLNHGQLLPQLRHEVEQCLAHADHIKQGELI